MASSLVAAKSALETILVGRGVELHTERHERGPIQAHHARMQHRVGARVRADVRGVKLSDGVDAQCVLVGGRQARRAKTLCHAPRGGCIVFRERGRLAGLFVERWVSQAKTTVACLRVALENGDVEPCQTLGNPVGAPQVLFCTRHEASIVPTRIDRCAGAHVAVYVPVACVEREWIRLTGQ